MVVDIDSWREGALTIAGSITSNANVQDDVRKVVIKDITAPQVTSHQTTLPNIDIDTINPYVLSGTCSDNGRVVTVKFSDGVTANDIIATPLCTAEAWSANINFSGLNEGSNYRYH